MSGVGFGYGYFKSSKGHYDPNARVYFNAVSTPFSEARKEIINTLVVTLKNDDNWNKIDRLWLMANEASDQGLISLVNPSSTPMTLVNAPAFVANQGFTGNGATSYINTNFRPSTDAIKYTLNSASYGIYSRTNSAVVGSDMSASDTGVGVSNMYAKFTDNKFYGSTNGLALESVANADTLGLHVALRTASATTALWKDGSSVFAGTSNSTALPGIPFFMLCRNLVGVATEFSTRQYSIGFLGSGTINQAALYTALQAYMTSIGSAV